MHAWSQLPDGQKGVIHVFPGSDPRELAEAVCAKHDLDDPKLRQVVERHITENMRALRSSQPAKSSGTTHGAEEAGAHDGACNGSAGEGHSRGQPSGNGSHVPHVPYAPAGTLPPFPQGESSDAMDEPLRPRPAGVLEQGASTSSELVLSAALSRTWETAVRWRAAARLDSIKRVAFSALVDLMWARRLARTREAAEAAAMEARSAEINELHAANARIAKLAFAQAGRPTNEATAELMEVGPNPGNPDPEPRHHPKHGPGPGPKRRLSCWNGVRTRLGSMCKRSVQLPSSIATLDLARALSP